MFVRKTGQKLFALTGIEVNLTGIDHRFSVNKPDGFEAEVLRMFADPRHPKGQRYAKVMMLNGKLVMRVMDPEYASVACLTCHGDPKGKRDMSGMKKERWKRRRARRRNPYGLAVVLDASSICRKRRPVL